MRTRVCNLYATTAADTDAAAQLIVPRNGLITAIAFSIRADGGGASGSVDYELSLSSARQNATNDSIGPLASASFGTSITTTGAGNPHENKAIAGLAIAVKEGDRLYLHAEHTGAAVTAYCRIFVYIAE